MGDAPRGGRQAAAFWRDPVLAAILLGALLLRLGYPALVGLAPRTPLHGFVSDETEYYGAAAVLADGRALHFYDTFSWTRVPGYPLFAGALFALFGRQPDPVFAVQAGLSVLTLAGLAALAARAAARAPLLGLSPRAAARIAALLGALWLPFTLFANLLLSETLFLLFIVGAFLLLARWADRVPGRLAGREGGPRRPAGWGATWLLAAGGLLGLAALTRATALGFVPLLALWVGGVAARAGGRGAAVRALGALLLAVGLVQAPQVAYNYLAYGQAILGDTSSGYNLWLAAVGVKDGERLLGDLRAIPNPVDRQSYAYTQGIAAIMAHPAAFLGKGLKETGDLWRINFASEERQVAHYSEGRVPAVHLWSLLAGEDLLYVGLVLACLLGLASAPADPLKALLGLWTLLWMGMAFVFFAVARFRFPVVALLLPWAPLGLAAAVRLIPRRLAGRAGPVAPPSRKSFGLFVLGLLFMIVVVPTIPWPETALGAARWTAQAAYRTAAPLITRDPARAEALLAGADAQIVDTQFAAAAARLAALSRAQPPDRAGLQALAARPVIALPPDSPLAARYEPFLLNGDISRKLNDLADARSVFGVRPVHAAGPEAVDWAAAFLLPPAADQIDLGGELDFGFVRGFYGSETVGQGAALVTFRWSGAHAGVHFPAAPPGRAVVVRWSGARPPGVPAARVRVAVQQPGRPVTETMVALPTSDTWQETVLAHLPAGGPPVAADLTLDLEPFVPGGWDPRALGVRVDWVALR